MLDANKQQYTELKPEIFVYIHRIYQFTFY